VAELPVELLGQVPEPGCDTTRECLRQQQHHAACCSGVIPLAAVEVNEGTGPCHLLLRHIGLELVESCAPIGNGNEEGGMVGDTGRREAW
jgi:hypothetical protein